jgi:hypothetical protein
LRSPKRVSEIEIAGMNGQGSAMLGSLGTIIAETSGRFLIRVSSDDVVAKVLDLAKQHGGHVVSLIPHKQSLEDLFTEKVIGGAEK